VTSRQRRILEVLATADRELYGLDIVAAGVAGRGSVHVELARLEDLGWIAAREVPPADPAMLPRRAYRITEAGGVQLLPAARSIR
jgi:DNA-binding PadR family transcriptional regulator